MYSGPKQPVPAIVTLQSIEADKALERSKRGCARHLMALDTTVGCSLTCRFCSIRFRNLEPGTVQLKVNLAELLERELAARRRTDRLPEGVLLNPASDAFQPMAPVLAVTHEVASLLLAAGVELHIRTRGQVPAGFAELFEAHSQRVHVEMAMFSMDRELSRLYEPGSPDPQQRLETIRRLRSWGLDVRVRIEPLIPFVSDTAGHLEDLVRHLRSVGVERAVASYLVLHPKVLERLVDTIPASHFHLIKGSFRGQAWRQVGVHQMTRLLPERTRREGYQRLRSIADKAGLGLSVCACQNPALGSDCHAPTPAERSSNPSVKRGQLDLFGSA
jgi:DNA repair photolyase